MYAEQDPLNKLDPSGGMALDFSTASSMMAGLSVQAVASFGRSYFIRKVLVPLALTVGGAYLSAQTIHSESDRAEARKAIRDVVLAKADTKRGIIYHYTFQLAALEIYNRRCMHGSTPFTRAPDGVKRDSGAWGTKIEPWAVGITQKVLLSKLYVVNPAGRSAAWFVAMHDDGWRHVIGPEWVKDGPAGECTIPVDPFFAGPTPMAD